MQNLVLFSTKLDTYLEAETVNKLLGQCNINNYNY